MANTENTATKGARAGRIHPHAVIRTLREALISTGTVLTEQNQGIANEETWGHTTLTEYREALELAERYEAQERQRTG